MAQTNPTTPSAHNPWLTFAVVSTGSLLGPLSSSLLTVALPAVSTAFHVDLQSVKWVLLIYLLITTGLLPVAGRLGQAFGDGRVYTIGFAIFAVGTVACALAPTSSLGWLIAARAAQAVGASLLFGVSPALVTQVVPAARRGLAFGMLGSIVAIGLISGPALGGVIVSKLSWPYLFWILVPVAVLGCLLGIVLLPPAPKATKPALPPLGVLSWLASVTGLVLVGEAFSKGLWLNYLPLTGLLTVVAIIVFAMSEWKGRGLFDYTLFLISPFWRGAAGAVMIYTITWTLILFLPFYLEDYRHLTEMQAGMLMGISPLATFFAGPISGHIADRFGIRLPLIGGLALTALSFFALVYAIHAPSLAWMGLCLALLGIGAGMFGAPNYAAMMGSVNPAQRSVASSMNGLTRNMGFLVGTSLGSLWFGFSLSLYGGRELMLAARSQELTQAVSADAFTYAFTWTLAACCALAILGLLVSLKFPNRVSPAGGTRQ